MSDYGMGGIVFYTTPLNKQYMSVVEINSFSSLPLTCPSLSIFHFHKALFRSICDWWDVVTTTRSYDPLILSTSLSHVVGCGKIYSMFVFDPLVHQHYEWVSMYHSIDVRKIEYWECKWKSVAHVLVLLLKPNVKGMVW